MSKRSTEHKVRHLKSNRWFAASWDWMSAHEPQKSLKICEVADDRVDEEP